MILTVAGSTRGITLVVLFCAKSSIKGYRLHTDSLFSCYNKTVDSASMGSVLSQRGQAPAARRPHPKIVKLPSYIINQEIKRLDFILAKVGIKLKRLLCLAVV